MKYFIFRNNTVERFFSFLDAEFGGYDELSAEQGNYDRYLWFYQAPMILDSFKTQDIIEDYIDKFNFTLSQLSADKQIIAFTISDSFMFKCCNSDFSLKRAVYSYNLNLFDKSAELQNLKVLDIDDFFKRYDISNQIDWKYYYLSQMIYNPKIADAFEQWFVRKLRAIESKRKKCLVLDLDNTLWGGILGEDGIGGIKLGGAYPGNAFSDFQQNLLQASNNGVILTVCSKNNEEDVFEAWEKHADMILRKGNFSTWKINWRDKATNIFELSKDLNIGLDSMVVIDDSPAERELVKVQLPDVEVPDFPKQPYLLRDFYTTIYEDYFQIYTLTKEDKVKTSQYKASFERKSYQTNFRNLDEYIRCLDIKLEIRQATEIDLARVSQMTQKTNQFNLTTKRYTEDQIASFIEGGDLIYCLLVKDKFGDSGMTGLAIIKVNEENKTAEIDSCLLSCRILGRQIENTFLAVVLKNVQQKGISRIFAKYIETLKNKQTEDFYSNNGFVLTLQQKGEKYYSYDLSHIIELNNLHSIENE